MLTVTCCVIFSSHVHGYETSVLWYERFSLLCYYLVSVILYFRLAEAIRQNTPNLPKKMDRKIEFNKMKVAFKEVSNLFTLYDIQQG